MAVLLSPTSINLTWTQPDGEVVDSYEVSFSFKRSCDGFNYTNTTTVNGNTRQYTLTGLQEFSNYTVTVVAVNGTRRSRRSSVNIATMGDGMSGSTIVWKYTNLCLWLVYWCWDPLNYNQVRIVVLFWDSNMCLKYKQLVSCVIRHDQYKFLTYHILGIKCVINRFRFFQKYLLKECELSNETRLCHLWLVHLWLFSLP